MLRHFTIFDRTVFSCTDIWLVQYMSQVGHILLPYRVYCIQTSEVRFPLSFRQAAQSSCVKKSSCVEAISLYPSLSCFVECDGSRRRCRLQSQAAEWTGCQLRIKLALASLREVTLRPCLMLVWISICFNALGLSYWGTARQAGFELEVRSETGERIQSICGWAMAFPVSVG